MYHKPDTYDLRLKLSKKTQREHTSDIPQDRRESQERHSKYIKRERARQSHTYIEAAASLALDIEVDPVGDYLQNTNQNSDSGNKNEFLVLNKYISVNRDLSKSALDSTQQLMLDSYQTLLQFANQKFDQSRSDIISGNNFIITKLWADHYRWALHHTLVSTKFWQSLGHSDANLIYMFNNNVLCDKKGAPTPKILEKMRGNKWIAVPADVRCFRAVLSQRRPFDCMPDYVHSLFFKALNPEPRVYRLKISSLSELDPSAEKYIGMDEPRHVIYMRGIPRTNRAFRNGTMLYDAYLTLNALKKSNYQLTYGANLMLDFLSITMKNFQKCVIGQSPDGDTKLYILFHGSAGNRDDVVADTSKNTQTLLGTLSGSSINILFRLGILIQRQYHPRYQQWQVYHLQSSHVINREEKLIYVGPNKDSMSSYIAFGILESNSK